MVKLWIVVAYLNHTPVVHGETIHSYHWNSIKHCEKFAKIHQRNFNRIHTDKQIIKWRCKDD